MTSRLILAAIFFAIGATLSTAALISPDYRPAPMAATLAALVALAVWGWRQ